MRMCKRFTYKLLTVFVACAIILIICINYYTNIVRGDKYITLLSDHPNKVGVVLVDQSKELSLNNLMNLSNFQYTLPNDLCRKYNKELLAIIIVTSYVGHDELRAAHRQAISQSKLSEMGFQRIFLLAEIPIREIFIQQRQLINEQHRFNDLLQGNFLEAYRNLSYKHVMGLRWASMECPRAKFIIKIDDDIVYDVFQLRRYLEALEVKQAALVTSPALLAGYILSDQVPKRNTANKWYVSDKDFAAVIYPPYLSGWLYITNPLTALRLVHAAQKAPFFWIDDTWVTGILRAPLNISMQRLNAWYSANPQFMDCCVRDLKQFSYECEYYVSPNGGDSKLIVEFLHNVEKCYFDECTKRVPEKSLNKTCVASAKHILPDHGEPVIHPIKL